jgi:arabinogalactan oligomer / maltooligosaccharide transport system permease protein
MSNSTLEKMKKNKTAYLYILPAMLVVLLVSLGPILYGLAISTMNMNLNTMGENARIKEVRLRTEIFENINSSLRDYKQNPKPSTLQGIDNYIEKSNKKHPRISLQNDRTVRDLRKLIADNEVKKIDGVISRIDEKLVEIDEERIVLFDRWIGRNRGWLEEALEAGDEKEAAEIEKAIAELERQKVEGGYYRALRFVGINNFVKALGGVDAEFMRVLIRTLIWTVINVFFHVSIGLLLALLLNRKGLRFKKFYRTVLILPWAVPQLITALVWRYLYHSEFGFINKVLVALQSLVGIAEPVRIHWLGHPMAAFAAVIIVNVWLGVPFMMMIATGALQSIPQDMYEAADIDGATGRQKLWKITLPLLKPAMIPSVVVGTIWTFTNFNVVYLITRGGPTRSTEIISTYTFSAIRSGLYSMASTFSIITFFILLALTLLNFKVSKAFSGEDM